MRHTSLSMMLFGFIAAFLISALVLVDWLAILRDVASDRAAGIPIAVNHHINTGRFLFVGFLISFSMGTVLLIRWRFWKRRFHQQ